MILHILSVYFWFRKRCHFFRVHFFSFLTAEIFEKRVGQAIPSYVVLNNYQIKEVNDTEKGLIFKQILTEKT